MITISKEKLEKSLSGVLRLAARGAVIQVQSGDKVIARIIGVPPPLPNKLENLIASGAVSWSGARKPKFDPIVLPSSKSKPSISDIVIQDRG